MLESHPANDSNIIYVDFAKKSDPLVIDIKIVNDNGDYLVCYNENIDILDLLMSVAAAYKIVAQIVLNTKS